MLTVFLCIFVTVCVLLVSYWWKNNVSTRSTNLPPGPFRFPLLGNLIQLVLLNHKKPWLAFAKLGEKYGDIMSLQLGSVYAVVFNSFNIMEEYLTKPEFSDRYRNAFLAERTFNKQLGLVEAKYPEPWREIRNFSLKTLRNFGFRKRNTMISVIQDEITNVILELKTSVKENDGIHKFDGYFTLSILNVIWSLLAGKRYEHNDPKLLKLVKISRKIVESVVGDVLMAYPQWKDWFPNWTGMTLQRKLYQDMNAFSQEQINERRMLGLYKTNPENLVDEFLREAEKHEGEADNIYTGENLIIIFCFGALREMLHVVQFPYRFSLNLDEQLVIIMNDFFIGGSDTTSNTLTWCILYLMLNPRVQRKLQEEIDSVVPQSTFPTLEQEPELHYLRAVVAETHRMCSAFPLMIPRAPTKDVCCGKFLIPKGAFILTNLHAVHYDEGYWKDPHTFRPERFIDENAKFKSDPRLKPFGFGKRLCPGESLVSMTLIHYITALLQNFTFDPVPNEPLPSTEPIPGVSLGSLPFQALVKFRTRNLME